MLTHALSAEHRHTQALSPRLQHAVRLLQLSSMEFAAQLRTSLGQNPFLELEDDAEATAAAGPSAGADRPVSTPDPAEAIDERSDADRSPWQDDFTRSRSPAPEAKLSALDLTPAREGLNDHLHRQLGLLALPPRDLLLARAVVESLDDDGYLRVPLAELSAMAAIRPAPTLGELKVALRHVQALEPAGVGARSVGECLQLQLESIACPSMRTLARRVVVDHLDLLAARDVQALARRLGQDVAQIEAVCDRIRHLDPRPGWRFSTTATRYIVPDVIVRRVRGQWAVDINPDIVPRVRLHQSYAQLCSRQRGEVNSELAHCLQDARWIVRNIEQRFSTILAVAQAVVKRQRHFLEFGAMAMRPLGLREIAEEVGVHESTVSRVTSNKYLATPSGIYELKFFFSRAMVSANGSACSATAIRELIKDIIAAEPPYAPLSDAVIARELESQGLTIARRTVTKYRQQLKLEAVDRRRRHHLS